MKSNGHYWCDECDDPAFGPQCFYCQHLARWISHRKRNRRANSEMAVDYFRQLHEVVNASDEHFSA